MKDYRDVIIKPVVTEKSMDLLADNKYTFVVDRRANKTQIKNAVENIFSVKVDNIRTINIKANQNEWAGLKVIPQTAKRLSSP